MVRLFVPPSCSSTHKRTVRVEVQDSGQISLEAGAPEPNKYERARVDDKRFISWH